MSGDEHMEPVAPVEPGDDEQVEEGIALSLSGGG
jgi:hypothetical protein